MQNAENSFLKEKISTYPRKENVRRVAAAEQGVVERQLAKEIGYNTLTGHCCGHSKCING